jgi:predicted DNA-binding ribbon-helix-helix protein
LGRPWEETYSACDRSVKRRGKRRAMSLDALSWPQLNSISVLILATDRLFESRP